jgi:HK97 family phage major capsid protein
VLTASGIGGDFAEAVRQAEVLSRLPVRKVPFSIAVPVHAGAFCSAWIGAGASIPMYSSAFDTITLQPLKLGTLTALTTELLRAAHTQSEEFIRGALIRAVAASADAAFLDPDCGAVASIRPASITNGATEITASGSNAAALNNDLPLLVDAVANASAAYWIMRPKTWAKVSALLGHAIAPADVRLLGFPVLTSNSAPGVLGSPATDSSIAFVDASGIAVADGDVEALASENATVELLDNPTNDSTTPTETTQVSLYQSGASAVRVVRTLNWQAGAGSVAFMRASY